MSASTTKAEVLPMPQQGIAAYSEFRNQLAELKATNAITVFDYESKDGNKAARSYVAKLRKTKAAIEQARKDEKAASIAYGRKVDAEADEITAVVQDMIDVHWNVLEEIENREKTRLADIKRGLDHIRMCGMGVIGDSPQSIGLCLYELKEKIKIDSWYSEFEDEARKLRDEAIAKLEAALIEKIKRDEEQAELERLRTERDERAQRDRDEEIRQLAAEKARQQEERKAAEERDAAGKREVELRLAAQRAETEKLEAQKQAEHEKKQAEIRAAQAVEDERRRVQAAADATAAEEARRSADAKNRAKVLSEIVGAFAKACGSQSCAQQITDAIAGGDVPHIQIIF